MTKYPTTAKERATFWGVPARTLYRWKGFSAPIGDYDEMLVWLSTRKNLPKAVLEKIRLPRPKKNVSSPDAGVSGAAAALKRLEAAELAAYARFQQALASGNPLLIREARENWLKTSESLRKFDLLVEQSRRDAGELVPVSEVQKFISIFISFMGTALVFGAENLVNELVGKSELPMYTEVRQFFSKSLFLGATAYFRGGGGQCDPDPRLTKYAEECIRKQFSHFPTATKDSLEANLLAMIQWASQQ